MRTYLVVMDESAEARAALRYAARRAARTGGAVEIVSVIEPIELVEWGGVQAAMEERPGFVPRRWCCRLPLRSPKKPA
jgi:nucleotide-binding universal stress UspA family protein